ncbi:hypothetical protein PF001_g690 [Phytophthora fragariae]|uniref:Uncharacterized protein n=1 Tax=Phytophthora fragariae TaxID=53985 RepID=A0A6A3UVJ6_9STRA|nr:hypothetical protein PF006_g477 [Phytophthora fragariae]KAE9329860.1 hypothetical protein PF001_g690 [Phytophthora fragariae]
MLRQPSPGASESDGDSGEQQAEAAPRSPTPSSDEHQNVVVEPIDKTVFLTWNEFHEYLAEYQQRTFQTEGSGTKDEKTVEGYQLSRTDHVGAEEGPFLWAILRVCDFSPGKTQP